MSSKKSIAVVLSGAVAQGAFEAGALQVLSRHPDLHITRVVSASAGSLNAVAFAAGVRAGRAREVADELVELWANHAGWSDVFHLKLSAWLPFRGLSDQTKLLALLEKHVQPATAVFAPISLCMVVAPLQGRAGLIGEQVATTYEKMIEFEDAAFDQAASLKQMFEVAVASASFPAAFAPYELPGFGPCIDGGVTDNTPIKYALRTDRPVDAIIVVNPTVEYTNAELERDRLTGTGLLGQVGDMLINERLFRDLHDAETVNAQLARLEALCPDKLTADQLTAVKAALKWTNWKQIFIDRIRPVVPLPGNAFSGFRHADDRAAYIQIGIDRATAVLSKPPWS